MRPRGTANGLPRLTATPAGGGAGNIGGTWAICGPWWGPPIAVPAGPENQKERINTKIKTAPTGDKGHKQYGFKKWQCSSGHVQMAPALISFLGLKMDSRRN